MEILYKSKNALVVLKPPAMPAQSDKSGDVDAMTKASDMLREMGEIADLWLIHRLDRVVGGLMVFARNKRSAAELSELVSGRGIAKDYLAVVDGVCEGDGVMKDYIFKDSTKSKAFIVDRKRGGVKDAELRYSAIETVETFC